MRDLAAWLKRPGDPRPSCHSLPFMTDVPPHALTDYAERVCKALRGLKRHGLAHGMKDARGECGLRAVD